MTSEERLNDAQIAHVERMTDRMLPDVSVDLRRGQLLLGDRRFPAGLLRLPDVPSLADHGCAGLYFGGRAGQDWAAGWWCWVPMENGTAMMVTVEVNDRGKPSARPVLEASLYIPWYDEGRDAWPSAHEDRGHWVPAGLESGGAQGPTCVSVWQYPITRCARLPVHQWHECEADWLAGLIGRVSAYPVHGMLPASPTLHRGYWAPLDTAAAWTWEGSLT